MTTPDEGWQARQDRLADERQREQTAATILAALIVRYDAYEPEANLEQAVALTDALRAALKVKP
jgi:hypothetical protein